MQLLVTLLLFLGATSAQEIVYTKSGPVQGTTLTVHLNNNVNKEISSFYAIPFAKPPLEDLRFEPPEKHEGWEEIFDATRLPDMCMQDPLGILTLTHPLWFRFSEDCLTLNVFKPAHIGEGGTFPVLVWFHGGGYTGGGSIQYPGHFMAAHDVVVVVVNYRLGIFGFASTPDKQIRGNMGMLDQIMALEWVRDNIGAFGGLPNQVTIYGQSAGASSAALHVVSPRSRGLFSQAIYESGTENNIWTLNYPGQEPDDYIYQVAPRVNCTTDDITEMIACMKKVPARDLRLNDWLDCTPGFFCQGFAPIVDGPEGFMPEHPLKLREELKENSVPTINGMCSDDGSLYTIYFIPEALQGGFNRTMWQFLLRDRLVAIFEENARNEEIKENSYQAFDWKYTPWPFLDDEDLNREAFNKMVTDGAFGFAWDRSAKLNSAYKATYTYQMAFRSLNGTSFLPEWMGVPHNGELPYVWGYAYLKENPEVRRDCQIFFDVVGWTPDDAVYADYVFQLWSNFAKYGNPTPTPIPGPFNNTLTTWPLYNIDTNLQVMWLGRDIEIKELYRQPDYYFFTDYISYVTEHPVVKSKKTTKSKFQFSTLRIKEQRARLARQFIEQQFPEESDDIIARLESL